MADGGGLRLITYLSPGIPLELYEIYKEYLEETLHTECFLMVESRWSGPPPDRVDPFTSDTVDIGFLCCPGYIRLATHPEAQKYIELCPVAPVHRHPKNESLDPIYFSDVIVCKDHSLPFERFEDLRGCRWSSNDVVSLSGSGCLAAQGVPEDFFSRVTYSGSHHKSIQEVLSGKADAAAVDSNTLRLWRREHPDDCKRLHVVCSFGPYPIQPIVLNARLPVETREKIANALLRIHKTKYSSKLEEYYVWGFKYVDKGVYFQKNLLSSSQSEACNRDIPQVNGHN